MKSAKSALGMLLIGTIFAPSAGANEAVIAPESLNHFLAGVRDFAGGKLTPGPLYDPQSVGLPSGGGTLGAVGGTPTGNSAITGKPPSWRAANGKLNGSSIARASITPAISGGQNIARAPTPRRR